MLAGLQRTDWKGTKITVGRPVRRRSRGRSRGSDKRVAKLVCRSAWTRIPVEAGLLGASDRLTAEGGSENKRLRIIPRGLNQVIVVQSFHRYGCGLFNYLNILDFLLGRKKLVQGDFLGCQ